MKMVSNRYLSLINIYIIGIQFKLGIWFITPLPSSSSKMSVSDWGDWNPTSIWKCHCTCKFSRIYFKQNFWPNHFKRIRLSLYNKKDWEKIETSHPNWISHFQLWTAKKAQVCAVHSWFTAAIPRRKLESY